MIPEDEGYLKSLNSENKKILIIKLLESENFKRLEFLESKNLIDLRKFSIEEAIEIIFDTNYNLKDYLKNYLKKSSNSMRIMHALLWNLNHGHIKDSKKLPDKLFKRSVLQCFIFGNSKVREDLVPRIGSSSFNYVEIGCRDKDECKEFLYQLFNNKDIEGLRYLHSKFSIPYYYLTKEALRELIFDQNNNFREFFLELFNNERDFRNLAIKFIRELAEKNDPHAKEILKREIIRRYKKGNLEEIQHFMRSADLDFFDEEELKEISFKSLEDNSFLIKCAQEHLLFTFVFTLLKKYIDKGFDDAKELLKNIFLKLNKLDIQLFNRLITGDYLKCFGDEDKQEVLKYLIKTENLFIILQLHYNKHLGIMDFKEDLLTPDTKLNIKLMEALNNTKTLESYALEILHVFAKKGNKTCIDLINNYLKKWIIEGQPEFLSYISGHSYIKDYLHEDELKSILKDPEIPLYINLLKTLDSDVYNHIQNNYKFFTEIINYLPLQIKKEFIQFFARKAKLTSRQSKNLGYSPLKTLLLIGEDSYTYLKSIVKQEKRQYFNYKPIKAYEMKRDVFDKKGYDLFQYSDYDEDDYFFIKTIEYLLIFLDKLEVSDDEIKEIDFNYLYYFIMRAGEVMNPFEVLKNFPESYIERIVDYLITRLDKLNEPHHYRNVLEFIDYNIIRLPQLNLIPVFFRILKAYNNFRNRFPKHSYNGFLVGFISIVYKEINNKRAKDKDDFFQDFLLKVFKQNPSVISSLLFDYLSVDNRKRDQEMSNFLLKFLGLLLDSNDLDVIYQLLKNGCLFFLEFEDLELLLQKFDHDNITGFLGALDKYNRENNYWHFDNMSDVEFILTKLKSELEKKEFEEYRLVIQTIITFVAKKYPSLFQDLVRNNYFKDLEHKEFKVLLYSENKHLLRNILDYVEARLFYKTSFQKFKDVALAKENNSFELIVPMMIKYYLKMLRDWNSEEEYIKPAIELFKLFGTKTIDITIKRCLMWIKSEKLYFKNAVFALLINDYLEIMPKEACNHFMKSIFPDLIAYIKKCYGEDGKHYYSPFNIGYILIGIFPYIDLTIFKQLLIKLDENEINEIKTTLLRMLEQYDRKFFDARMHLTDKKVEFAEIFIDLIERDFNLDAKFVTVHGKKHWVINDTLNLSKLEITDINEIHGLKELINLKELNLKENRINKIKGLDLLVNLKKLNLKSNYITEIKGLESLVNLESLNLDATLNEYKRVISEIKGLDTLTKLRDLSIQYHNAITEIKGLENLENLTYLYLTDNQIEKITGLDRLKNLESLWLSHNSIKKLEGLENLRNLRRINVDNQRYHGKIASRYHDNNGPEYVVNCLQKSNRKIEGTIPCPNTDCNAIIYPNWNQCPICNRSIKRVKVQ